MPLVQKLTDLQDLLPVEKLLKTCGWFVENLLKILSRDFLLTTHSGNTSSLGSTIRRPGSLSL